jgi:hypothetical protein
LALSSSPAHAETDATRGAARTLGAEGVEAYQAGDYATASDKLGRAFEIVRAPSLGLWSARALVKLGKLVAASERYLEVTRLDASKGDTAVQRQAQADAATEHEQLLARVPKLVLSVSGAQGDVSLSLDGVAVPVALLGAQTPVDPGAHVVEARDSQRSVSQTVSFKEGQLLRVALDLAHGRPLAAGEQGAAAATTAGPREPNPPDAAPAGRQLPLGMWVGVAVAGAGFATGGVAALVALNKKSELDCADDRCPPSKRDDVSATNTWITVSTIGCAVGAVGVATAVTFFLSAPRKQQQAGVTPWIGPGSAGVMGRF